MSRVGTLAEGGYTHTHNRALSGGYREVIYQDIGSYKILQYKICSKIIHFEKHNFYLVISTHWPIPITFQSLTLHSVIGKGDLRAIHQGPELRQK
jgi:hypothetical protein